MQVVLSWRAGGRIHRQVVTRQLDLTTVLASYCRDMDVQIAAVLLAKGVLQDLPSSADHDELAATRDSIGAHTPCRTPPLIRCMFRSLHQHLKYPCSTHVITCLRELLCGLARYTGLCGGARRW